MHDRSSKDEKEPKRSRDLDRRAWEIVRDATEGPPLVDDQDKPKKNPAAVALGRLGGKKGGKAGAERMTPEERSEAARRAARPRWKRR